MSRSDVTINLDSDLRRHLLFGSIGLVIAVLIIFVNVTLHLASDLGEAIESDHLQEQAQKISILIQDVIESDKLELIKNRQLIRESFVKHINFFEEDIVRLKIWLNGEVYNIKSDNSFNHISEINSAIQTEKSDHGFAKLNDNRFFWVYKYAPEECCELLLLRKVSTLDRAIEYMSTRLTISAFLTFWLAVWAALIISALITKRFIKGNIRLNFLANHDMLTQLHNRTYLHEVVNNYIQEQELHAPKHYSEINNASILLIDLNKFKEVNDAMGHHVGDRLLQAFAERLSKFVNDNTYVFRYGGDEFIIWQESKESITAEKLAENVIKICRQPMLINGSKFEMSASIGIACYPEDAKTLNDLLKNADIAMYRAKRLRLGYQSYEKCLDLRSQLRVNLSGQLNQALTDGQFILYYQPKVKLLTGEIFGVEALVRWQHPTEGLLAPGMFINLIEQSDFVHQFTRYVFAKAISQCREWLDNKVSLSVAVNISPYNLMDPELIPFIEKLLAEYRVPASLIEVELTESSTMVAVETTEKVFKQLKNIGVMLSIDDFGTGMSSLAYIKQLKVDYIKIDRSFVINLTTDVKDEAIIMSMLLLCQKLNREVIIEGVETNEQREKLIDLGCKFAQGYYFYKPMPAEQLAIELHNRSSVECFN